VKRALEDDVPVHLQTPDVPEENGGCCDEIPESCQSVVTPRMLKFVERKIVLKADDKFLGYRRPKARKAGGSSQPALRN
jgi:hypothetical protein